MALDAINNNNKKKKKKKERKKKRKIDFTYKELYIMSKINSRILYLLRKGV